MHLYQKPVGVRTRWTSFENPSAAKGRGGMENQGAKGRPCEPLAAGEVKTLASIRGAGVINRIWMTLSDRSPKMLRSLRIEMYWDDCPTPAVSCPLGDFFGIAHGRTAAHSSALFANPEGRSFICTVPMPFRKAARITLTNESPVENAMLFYDVNYEEMDQADSRNLYLHAHWRRQNPTGLGEDFTILPKVSGEGRFLGCNVGVIADAAYGTCWWGEGEVKVYLDGDDRWPTLVGTGAEDYIGTGWGMNVFFQPYQGCAVADREARQWAFYRYHIPDPVYFESDCRVDIQSMGGSYQREIAGIRARGGEIRPISIAGRLLLDNPQLNVEDFPPDSWCNQYRRDDYCATAYFYLDRPENGLPALAAVEERIAGLSDRVENKRADT